MFGINNIEEIKIIEETIQRKTTGKKVAVYTTIFNSFEPIEPLISTSDSLWDTYIISDGSNRRCPNGAIEIITSFKLQNPRLSAKYFKICPQAIFSEYEYSLYIDGNCIVNPKISELITEKCTEKLTAIFFRHNKRNCAYEESKSCLLYGKEEFKRIIKLWYLMYRHGYPKSNGLIQGGFILRQHNHFLVRNMMQKWWEYIIQYTERDQLLFNYIAWKNNFPFEYLEGLTLHNSPYTQLIPHKSIQYDKSGRRKSTLRGRFLDIYFERVVKQKSF